MCAGQRRTAPRTHVHASCPGAGMDPYAVMTASRIEAYIYGIDKSLMDTEHDRDSEMGTIIQTPMQVPTGRRTDNWAHATWDLWFGVPVS
jgi:hypothetical protein